MAAEVSLMRRSVANIWLFCNWVTWGWKARLAALLNLNGFKQIGVLCVCPFPSVGIVRSRVIGRNSALRGSRKYFAFRFWAETMTKSRECLQIYWLPIYRFNPFGQFGPSYVLLCCFNEIRKRFKTRHVYRKRVSLKWPKSKTLSQKYLTVLRLKCFILSKIL